MPNSISSLTSEFGYTNFMISNTNDYTGKATLTFLDSLINISLKNKDVFEMIKEAILLYRPQNCKLGSYFQIIYRLKYFSYSL